MSEVFIDSEFKRLREVMIHSPGPEHDVMLPEHLSDRSAQYLLFEDLIIARRARREHEELRRIFAAVARVVEFADLLDAVLRDPYARTEITDRVVQVERLDVESARRLRDLDPDHLRSTLLTGHVPGGGPPLFAPAPNLLFTRDIGAIVGNCVVLCHAGRIRVRPRGGVEAFEVRPRLRETFLMKSVFRHHPRFRGAAILDVNEGGRHDLALEGGDIVVVSERVLAVGCGERTQPEAVEALARAVFAHDLVDHVLRVHLPPHRSCMHLDTIFSLLSRDECVYHAPLIDPGGPARVEVEVLHRQGEDGVRAEPTAGLFQALAGLGVLLSGIRCGGADPIHQAREQWMDASNAFVLSPGVVLAYAWNEHTLAELGEAGYEALTADEFVRNARFRLATGRKTTVLLEGPELSKARGGPRCLSMPLLRAE